ncbi:hypothetical protein VZG28_05215 [Synechococcus elongatus IITB4]|uniref:hypothetical protein n=1 Tax=Synechococcus elongatus TaxID=32046 RepID=UPI0030D609BA
MSLDLIKHEGTQILEYPYGLSELQRDNPNSIFTLPLTEGSLEGLPVSFVDPTEPPNYDPELFDLGVADPVLIDGRWNKSYRLIEISPEEQDNRYNAKADWRGFYNGLLINPAFGKIRFAAGQNLEINAAYIDIANALALAALGAVNVPAVQACFNNAMALLVGDFALTEEEMSSLSSLLQACFLDRLILLS